MEHALQDIIYGAQHQCLLVEVKWQQVEASQLHQTKHPVILATKLRLAAGLCLAA